jgi:hypothetical protein
MRVRHLVLAVMLVFYGLFGLLGVAVLAPNTFIGADLETFQRAGDSLWSQGDPYAANAGQGYNFQYRYPPLLAMLMPILGWPPLWYALMVGSTLLVFYYWWKDAGWFGLLPITMLGGTWAQPLLNGNVQPALMALLAVVPRYRRAGAVALAAATMLKLHPVLGIVWYVGRRDWTALRWYVGAMAALGVVQLPWADDFVRYYLTDPDASPTEYAGWGLRLAGDVAWLIGAAVTGVLAYRFATTRYGWMLNIVFQLAALPRLIPTNLALLLSAPLPSRRSRQRERELETQTVPTPSA